MKILQLTIKSCYECPYDDYDCHHTDFVWIPMRDDFISNKVGPRKRDYAKNSTIIPDWCPLPDVSERNKQLSDYI